MDERLSDDKTINATKEDVSAGLVSLQFHCYGCSVGLSRTQSCMEKPCERFEEAIPCATTRCRCTLSGFWNALLCCSKPLDRALLADGLGESEPLGLIVVLLGCFVSDVANEADEQAETERM